MKVTEPKDDRLEGILTFSANRGCYVVRRGHEERELTRGMSVTIHLDDLWIPGTIAYRKAIYTSNDAPPEALGGFYFVGSYSGLCGLCAGMTVRVNE